MYQVGMHIFRYKIAIIFIMNLILMHKESEDDFILLQILLDILYVDMLFFSKY